MAKIAHNGQVLINVFVAFWAGTVLKPFRDLCIEIGTHFYWTQVSLGSDLWVRLSENIRGF